MDRLSKHVYPVAALLIVLLSMLVVAASPLRDALLESSVNSWLLQLSGAQWLWGPLIGAGCLVALRKLQRG